MYYTYKENMFVAALANIIYFLIHTVFTYHNGKYQGWNGTEQTIIREGNKATDGKDN